MHHFLAIFFPLLLFPPTDVKCLSVCLPFHRIRISSWVILRVTNGLVTDVVNTIWIYVLSRTVFELSRRIGSNYPFNRGCLCLTLLFGVNPWTLDCEVLPQKGEHHSIVWCNCTTQLLRHIAPFRPTVWQTDRRTDNASYKIVQHNRRKQWVRVLTLSPPIPLRLYTLPYWSNPPFLITDILALWRSGLSARAPECQN